MSYRADVAKHRHVQQQQADGERELTVVLCTLYPYCLRLRLAGPCWLRWLFGTRGTELARKSLIFLCKSAQKFIIPHRLSQKIFWGGAQTPPPLMRGTPTP